MGEHAPVDKKRPQTADLDSGGFGKPKRDLKRRHVEKQPVIEGPWVQGKSMVQIGMSFLSPSNLIA